ncbi:hypothetical protein [Actinoplanes sp. NPDC020271]|uniref:hypothetical protein n=1 Tax=Actinoplanes sp. NPDC020271 TaxID=3363896 RepID=UPI0037ADEFE8
MNGDARLIRVLVACYPPGWRQRYGDEYTQLLCDLRVHRRPALMLDSLRGAVRAHGGALMSHDSPLTVVVGAAGLFTVAGLGFAKLAEDVTGTGGTWYAVLVAASAVALLAVAVAAAPGARALRDTATWRYPAVPIAGAVLWYGELRLAAAIASGHGVHSAPTVTGFLLVAVTGIAVVAATAWAAVRVLRRVPSRPRPVVTAVIAGGMAVATVAALLWGLRVRSGDPGVFHGNHGILATPFVVSWVLVLAALAGATTLAALAGRRGPVTRRR